jgi:hypothetical protein
MPTGASSGRTARPTAGSDRARRGMAPAPCRADPMAPTLRLARETDAHHFKTVHASVLDEPPYPALLASVLSAPHLHVAVALDDWRMIGMYSGVTYHHPDKPPQWWVNELGVGRPWRRRLATRLGGLCAGEALGFGCTELRVVADPTPRRRGSGRASAGRRPASASRCSAASSERSAPAPCADRRLGLLFRHDNLRNRRHPRPSRWPSCRA